MSEHQTDQYRDLRIEQLAVIRPAIYTLVRAAKWKTRAGDADVWRARAKAHSIAADEWEGRARDLARRITLAINDTDPLRAYNLLVVNVLGEVEQWDNE